LVVSAYPFSLFISIPLTKLTHQIGNIKTSTSALIDAQYPAVSALKASPPKATRYGMNALFTKHPIAGAACKVAPTPYFSAVSRTAHVDLEAGMDSLAKTI
jgi:hypothetical protein